MHVWRDDVVCERAGAAAHGFREISRGVVFGVVVCRIVWVPGPRDDIVLLCEDFAKLLVAQAT